MNLKERFQTPVLNDTIILRLLVLNRSIFTDVQEIDRVEIYVFDPTLRTEDNHHGKRLVQTITPVTQNETGQYSVETILADPQYVIGKYSDVWYLNFRDYQASTVEQYFQIYADQWFTTPTPLVYDFSFSFIPNRMVQGENKYIQITVTPNVPRASDLVRFYEGLVANSELFISIEQACGPCVPQEEDLRLIVDHVPVIEREKNKAFYKIDTEDMDCGIYNVFFTLCFGGNKYISTKNQLQIFK